MELLLKYKIDNQYMERCVKCGDSYVFEVVENMKNY